MHLTIVAFENYEEGRKVGGSTAGLCILASNIIGI